MHKDAETIGLTGTCPTCGKYDLSFLDYEDDNECIFDCYHCGYSSTIPLTDLREWGFYPEMFHNAKNFSTSFGQQPDLKDTGNWR